MGNAGFISSAVAHTSASANKSTAERSQSDPGARGVVEAGEVQCAVLSVRVYALTTRTSQARFMVRGRRDTRKNSPQRQRNHPNRV